MALFPSQEWFSALVETLTHSPEWAKDAKDFVGTSIWVITPEGSFTQTVRFYIAYDHGRIPKAYVMPEGDAREAENTTTAPLGIWRRIIEGKLNPTPALLRGQLKIEGMSIKVIRNVKTLQSLFEHALRIPTEFPT